MENVFRKGFLNGKSKDDLKEKESAGKRSCSNGSLRRESRQRGRIHDPEDDDKPNYNPQIYNPYMNSFWWERDDLKKSVQKTLKKHRNIKDIVSELQQIKLVEGREIELCRLLIEFCCDDPFGTGYRSIYSIAAASLCKVDQVHRENFEKCFAELHHTPVNRYGGSHKVGFVAKLFAHLLAEDAISWRVFESVKLTSKELNNYSFNFLGVLFDNLDDNMGIVKLKERFNDSSMYEYFKYIFPLDTARNTKFAIQFYKKIGLEDLTENLLKYWSKRKYVKIAKLRPVKLDSDSSSSELDSGYSDEETDKQKKLCQRKPRGNHISIGGS